MDEKLQAAIGELAACKAPDDVAELLRRKGFRGVPEDLRACPVARYLSAAAGDDAGIITVHYDGIRVGDKEEDLPDPVCRFVEMFDLGQYPDLGPDGERQTGKATSKKPEGAIHRAEMVIDAIMQDDHAREPLEAVDARHEYW
jgi:hypothetical protein